MRDFQTLDPQALKAFFYAAETLSFTRAAERAALTQSGISQHVAKLETALGVSLFLRVGRKVVLTDAGRNLKAFAESYLDQVDTLLETVRKDATELRGLVRYAMPDTCLYTPHFSALLTARKAFPGIDLNVTICHSESVIELLLSGQIDFGFVTKVPDHHDIKATVFAHEHYVLISRNPRDLKISRPAELLERDFVQFPGMNAFLCHWQQKHFPKHKPASVRDLRIRGEVNSLAGAITMVRHGVGMTILPKHCVENELKRGLVHAGPVEHCQSPIYIVENVGKRQTARAGRVLQIFWDMSKS